MIVGFGLLLLFRIYALKYNSQDPVLIAYYACFIVVGGICPQGIPINTLAENIIKNVQLPVSTC